MLCAGCSLYYVRDLWHMPRHACHDMPGRMPLHMPRPMPWHKPWHAMSCAMACQAICHGTLWHVPWHTMANDMVCATASRLASRVGMEWDQGRSAVLTVGKWIPVRDSETKPPRTELVQFPRLNLSFTSGNDCVSPLREIAYRG